MAHFGYNALKKELAREKEIDGSAFPGFGFSGIWFSAMKKKADYYHGFSVLEYLINIDNDVTLHTVVYDEFDPKSLPLQMENRFSDLEKEALRIANIMPKNQSDSFKQNVFLSHDKKYAIVSSEDIYTRKPTDLACASISNQIIDLNNKNIDFGTNKIGGLIKSAEFSPSDEYIFCVTKESFMQLRCLGFISLDQKGDYGFSLRTNERNSDDLSIDVENSSGYVRLIKSAAISPHGQHIVVLVQDTVNEVNYEKLILFTIEHITKKFNDKQLEFTGALPLAAKYYQHKGQEIVTDNAVHYIMPKNTHIRTETILSAKDADTFSGFPEDYRLRIGKLWKVIVPK